MNFNDSSDYKEKFDYSDLEIYFSFLDKFLLPNVLIDSTASKMDKRFDNLEDAYNLINNYIVEKHSLSKTNLFGLDYIFEINGNNFLLDAYKEKQDDKIIPIYTCEKLDKVDGGEFCIHYNDITEYLNKKDNKKLIKK